MYFFNQPTKHYLEIDTTNHGEINLACKCSHLPSLLSTRYFSQEIRLWFSPKTSMSMMLIFPESGQQELIAWCGNNILLAIVWFQKISVPLPRMVLPIRPPHPLGISVPEGSCTTPHPPGISYFPFHGLYLPHLEIINHVPLKINCSHLKTQFFL